jgi:hypothetical protein
MIEENRCSTRRKRKDRALKRNDIDFPSRRGPKLDQTFFIGREVYLDALGGPIALLPQKQSYERFK